MQSSCQRDRGRFSRYPSERSFTLEGNVFGKDGGEFLIAGEFAAIGFRQACFDLSDLPFLPPDVISCIRNCKYEWCLSDALLSFRAFSQRDDSSRKDILRPADQRTHREIEPHGRIPERKYRLGSICDSPMRF